MCIRDRRRVARALGRTVWSDQPEVSDEATEQPTGAQCRPWDRTDFLQRLSTFKSYRWFAKPSALSPVECARHGWSNSGVDSLMCGVCSTSLVMATPLDLCAESTGEITAQLALSLAQAHSAHCGWSNNPCHSSVAHTAESSPAASLQALKKRYTSLVSAAIKLEFVQDPQLMRISAPLRESDTVAPKFPELSALLLALFGWAVSEGKSDRLTCQHCTRTVGVWNFKGGNAAEKSPHGKRQATEELALFDPIQEHYWYCPWVQADAGASNSEAALIYPGAWKACASYLLEMNHSCASLFSPDRHSIVEPINIAANVAKFLSGSTSNQTLS
eukprot:TRINITY_DN2814_c0_g1_i1.p1 TRINITY_DN2814_c0_g1~~TRINITY_DN2814_c0_g1_i1.p1  ORF type:complete len:330 (-),score=51.28 TRINITY_DN2814_c0_g1_i1:149-1138(-)